MPRFSQDERHRAVGVTQADMRPAEVANHFGVSGIITKTICKTREQRTKRNNACQDRQIQFVQMCP
jgi:hypothetical protein